jgi:hypothetical protein
MEITVNRPQLNGFNLWWTLGEETELRAAAAFPTE